MMRFVIVDLDGASRDYFSERQDVVEALEELESEHAGATGEVFVVTYDEQGSRVGEPERGDEIVALYSRARSYWFDSASRPVVHYGAASSPVTRDRVLVAVGTPHEAESA